jgi:PTS system nitrogen regulatory IIA component
MGRMNRFLTEADIAGFLGQNLPEVRRALQGSRLRCLQKQGRMVYSRDEVMNWISENFSSLTTERLMKADVASADHGGLDPYGCGITQLLQGGRIYFPERISTKPSVFRSLSARAVELGSVYDQSELCEQLEKREGVLSTALRCGAALVHPLEIAKMYVERELLLLMIPPHPVPFGEASGRLTSIFFLMLFPDPHRHVHVLARINRLLRDDEFIEILLSSTTEEEVINAVRHRELQVISSSVRG